MLQDREFRNIVVATWVTMIDSGVAAAILAELLLLGTGWIFWPIVLFTLSGAAFGMRVAPLQRRLAALTRGSENTAQSWESYEALYRRWEMWDLVAIATPAIALIIMVLKPAIPAL